MAMRIPFDESFWQEYLAGQEAQLPPLADIEDVSDRVMRVLGGNPGVMQLQGTNTYLVGTGTSRILIDTGEGLPCWIERIVKILEERELDLAYILLTHWHGDHTGGVPNLIAHKPVLASRVYKNQPDRNQNPIVDGQIFQVEGATIRAIFTPGHAVDHMSFLLEEEAALFTGDNVLGHGYSVVQDLSVYMDSLARMEKLGCAAGYPAHGAKIHDLPTKMREYINHNEFRVEQVFTTLSWNNRDIKNTKKAGRVGMTLPEIVRSIYGDIPVDLVENAIIPFLSQVLWKLAEDRKVGFEPGEPKKRRWFGLLDTSVSVGQTGNLKQDHTSQAYV
ncbi:metallo-beta-lactamase domain protein [Arthroderma uncinatum]|uniref:metallo-beta-lactamase domain protein n=1 Tax=Arthroderma uncinatum TaxID=74035 RepID=UPI00144AA058|nr:metallo-beta-lactamase domain protein [Arthroderma uncinatum]KAF3481328.1 metallo-beta-lactamase domain protein [Arthroderma uncinatum]